MEAAYCEPDPRVQFSTSDRELDHLATSLRRSRTCQLVRSSVAWPPSWAVCSRSASGAATAELTQAATRPPSLLSSASTSEGLAPTGLVADVTERATTTASSEAPSPAPALSSDASSVGAVPAETSREVLTPSAPFVPSVDAASSNLRDGRIITGATPHRFILFTFDDGPDVRYTRALLDALDQTEIRALFFLTTRRFEGQTPYERGLAEIAREIAARGHRVGLALDGSRAAAARLDAGSRDAGRRERRDPRARGGHAARALPATRRQPLAAHRRLPREPRLHAGALEPRDRDVQVRSADAVLDTFRRVLEVRERDHDERGGIVLLHDIHAWSIEAFPRIVAYLDRRNCDFLRAGDELYDFVDDPAFFFEARHEGDAADAVAEASIPADVIAARQIRARARATLRCEDTAALDAIIAGD
jgi:peptidoglycan/xylan/chitin deacetylase (PgdA/CDA1 family)